MINKLQEFLGKNYHYVGKGILLLLTVVAIMSMFPRQTHFRFEYQEGQPWLYDDLKAPYDFPLLKSEEQLKNEREQTLKEIPLFFRRDSSIADRKFMLFADRLINMYPEPSDGTSKDKNSNRDFINRMVLDGSNFLEQLYNKGVMDDLTAEELDPDKSVVVIDHNIFLETTAGELFSIGSAELFLQKFFSRLPKDEQTAAQKLLIDLIDVNLTEDRELYLQFERQKLSDIAPSRGIIRKGDEIITRGNIIDDKKEQLLRSFEESTAQKQYKGYRVWQVYLGHFLITLVVITLFFAFLFLFRKDIFENNRQLFLILLLLVVIAFVFTRVLYSEVLSHYIVPICILPIVVRAFFNTGVALFTLIVCTLILGPIAPNGFEFIFLHFVAGSVAIFSIISMRKRSQMFVAAILIFIAYVVCYTGLNILYQGNFSGLKLSDIGWFLANAGLTLFALPLIYIFEKLFGLISDVSLMELSDTNSPLLKDLSSKAPGTFQHSIQVANLTEAAVQVIGGNPLLARVGALYHDVGKVDDAIYFIENQGGSVNPHDDLPFEQSAEIIIGHVHKGIEMARKARVPDQIIDFIRTHHGTTRVQYFYKQYLKHFPEGELSEEKFSYPGPKPFSKETAALMMADVTEAASRSLDKHDEESIDNLVENLIEHLIESKQFDQSPLTFNDVNKVKALFKKMLKSIYHVRVAY